MDQLPLAEYTPGKAIIEPAEHVRRHHGFTGDVPEHCVMPIYGRVIHKLLAEERLEIIYDAGDITPQGWFIYRMEYDGRYVVIAHPGIGAPMAVALMDEIIGLGCRKFVACGSAGVIEPHLQRGSVVIPSAALRDEGTSFHYLPPSRTVTADPHVVKKLESVLDKHGVSYVTGMTWTTDGLYRETKERIQRRQVEGCITVEMECAGFLAAAQFRGVTFGQYLSVSDCVGGQVWDPRHTSEIPTHEEKLFWLSVEACLSL